MRSFRLAKALALSLVFATPLAAGAEPPAGVQQEVKYLLTYIGNSGCEFFRNGSWSDAKAAQAHVRLKYDHLAGGGKIATALDFIDKAASESSLSGIAYQVRCGPNPPVSSRAWLSDALAKYRTVRP